MVEAVADLTTALGFVRCVHSREQRVRFKSASWTASIWSNFFRGRPVARSALLPSSRWPASVCC